MIDPDVVKRITNSFHSMKDHLSILEKEYSQLLEKGETRIQEEEEDSTVSLK